MKCFCSCCSRTMGDHAENSLAVRFVNMRTVWPPLMIVTANLGLIGGRCDLVCMGCMGIWRRD